MQTSDQSLNLTQTCLSLYHFQLSTYIRTKKYLKSAAVPEFANIKTSDPPGAHFEAKFVLFPIN